MGTEELLAIVGIILTIIAFISEKNRHYIFLKFSKIDFVILFVSFLAIHYLIVFDWLQENWYPSLSVFTICNGIPPAAVAYILTLIVIAYILYKIFYAFFPIQNLEKVIAYYKKLNLSMEHPYLLELIRTHHKKDIPTYLNRIKNINVAVDPFDTEANQKMERVFKKAINTSRLIYANNVFFDIVDDEVFINNTVNNDPYFFIDIIATLNTQRGSNNHFVEKYLEILMLNKNHHFFREIRNTIELDTAGNYKIKKENQIVYSLFSDIKVAEFNYIWRPIANVALWELQNENSAEAQFLKGSYFSEQHEYELSNTKMKTAIHFFDIMIREAIAQKAKFHMWLFYYHRFIESLIHNIPIEAKYNQDDYEPTLNHKLIHEAFDNMLEWLDIGIELKINNLSIDTCKCIGRSIYEITSSDVLSCIVKVRVIDKVVKKYCDYGWNEDAKFQMLELEKIFLTPSDKVKWNDQDENIEKYIDTINATWSKFDKLPYTANGKNISYSQFEDSIIDKINQLRTN